MFEMSSTTTGNLLRMQLATIGCIPLSDSILNLSQYSFSLSRDEWRNAYFRRSLGIADKMISSMLEPLIAMWGSSLTEDEVGAIIAIYPYFFPFLTAVTSLNRAIEDYREVVRKRNSGRNPHFDNLTASPSKKSRRKTKSVNDPDNLQGKHYEPCLERDLYRLALSAYLFIDMSLCEGSVPEEEALEGLFDVFTTVSPLPNNLVKSWYSSLTEEQQEAIQLMNKYRRCLVGSYLRTEILKSSAELD